MWANQHLFELDAEGRPTVVAGVPPDFFSATGYSTLHRLQVYCVRASIDWVLIAGREVRRLLRICDPDGLFPIADNIVSAVAALARGPHRTSQLSLLR